MTQHLGRVVGGSAYLGLGRTRAGVMLAGLMTSLLLLYAHLALLGGLPAAVAALVVFVSWRGRLVVDWVAPLVAFMCHRKQAPLPAVVDEHGATATMALGTERVGLWQAMAPPTGCCVTRAEDLERAQREWAGALDLTAAAVRQVTWAAVLAPAGERERPAPSLDALVAEAAPMSVYIGLRLGPGADLEAVAQRLASSGARMLELSAAAGAQVLEDMGVGKELVDRWAELHVGGEVVRSWAIWAWPHGELEAHVLAPLLAPRQGCYQSLAVHMWPVPPGAAVRKARRSRAIARTRASTRAQIGSMERLEDAWETDTAIQREADTLQGRSLWHMAGVVSLRAPTLELLALGAEALAVDAIRANVELRPMSGQQADAWRASLPLGLVRWREVA